MQKRYKCTSIFCLSSSSNLPFVHRQKNAWEAVMHLSTDFMYLCGFYTYMCWGFYHGKVLQFMFMKSLQLPLCIMPPLHVISNDNYQILARLQDTKMQECCTTLFLSAGTLCFQMEPYKDIMFKQEGNYGGIILTVVKNYKYK